MGESVNSTAAAVLGPQHMVAVNGGRAPPWPISPFKTFNSEARMTRPDSS